MQQERQIGNNRFKCVNDVIYLQYCVMLSAFNVPTFVWWKFIHNLKLKKMKSEEVKGNWNEQKGKLKQRFAVLTDNDLMYEEGKKDEMLGKLQKKIGKTKEEFDKIIEDL